MLDVLGRARGRLRRLILTHRRALAAVLAGLAALLALQQTRSPAAAVRTVEVAATDLPAGTRLTEADLDSVQLPADAAPRNAAPSPLGAVLSGPIAAGEPITETRLVGSALVRAGPGRSAVPVRFTDAAMASLLRPGDVITLLRTDPQDGSSSVAASAVRVLALTPQEGSDASLPGRLVILSVPDSGLTQATSAATGSYLTFAWAAS